MTTHLLKIAIYFSLVCASSLAVSGQDAKDPCGSVKVQLTSSDAPDVTLVEVKKDQLCFDGGFIRAIGIYRVAFENSDLYDPIDQTARAWINLDPFYPAVKRCGSPANLQTLNRKDGGTFGFIALGIIKTQGRFGHMNGWISEFQVICLEKVELLSRSGSVFSAKSGKEQKKILNWYNKEIRKLY
jgi:hypothetical protein